MAASRRLYGLIVVCACGSGPAPPASARIGQSLVAAIEAADEARLPWRCGSPTGPTLADETLGEWKLSGHTMKREGGDAIAIGVVADAGGGTAPTLGALGRLRGKLEGVDLVITLGGMGTTRPDLLATLGVLAERAKWPLVVLPGDLEAVPDVVAAIAALRTKGLFVVDGRLAQRIELPGVVIATIAGTADVSRLVAGAEGCAYAQPDVAMAFAALTPSAGIRILATAEAPRIVIDGEPAGELALVPGAGQAIDVSLHGPVAADPSPARTGGRDGAAVSLTPGTSDASTRLPGPRKSPSAGLLTVRGTTWQWQPIADTD